MRFSKIRLLYPLIFSLLAISMHYLGAESNQQLFSIQETREALGWKGWFTISVVLLTFVGLVLEVRPPDITMLFSTGILMIAGILSPAQFLEGFSNDIIMTIAMLCVIVRALEVNGLLEMIGRKVLSKSKSFYRQMLSLTAPVAASSAFLNNTPIVLLMTPIVRRWAIQNKYSPSQFLLPLSYAAVMGGACTMIGTSTNLVVYGLLRNEHPDAGFGFFELSYIGIPCTIAGILYLLIFGRSLLPERTDPNTAISEESRELAAEFKVLPNCPLANRTIQQVSRRYFRGESLIQIERNNVVIDAPGPDFVIFVGDRLVFAADIHKIAELHAIPYLQSLADPHFKLDVSSSHFSEVVIPTTSLMIGKTLRQVNFRNNYGASVLAVYREGWRVLGDVRDVILQAGDTLMLLSGEPWIKQGEKNKDFYYIKHHEKLQVFNPFRSMFVLLILIAMITATTLGVPIVISAMSAVFTLLITRSISIREAQNSVIWNILLLIACSFALGRAMDVTGVAGYFAEIFLTVAGTDPYMLIGGLLMLTIVSTEFMTNNATAMILFPIALKVGQLAGYNSLEAIRTIGITVAIGASCGYAIPTGYQTHMIVYGPGGYRFKDFIKMGVPMDIIIWTIATLLIPRIWPMVAT